MNIHLDPKYERQIESLAAATSKTIDEILEDVVKKGLAETPPGDSTATAKAQRTAIKRLQEKLRALPQVIPDDGFDASQHDKVIYRREG